MPRCETNTKTKIQRCANNILKNTQAILTITST